MLTTEHKALLVKAKNYIKIFWLKLFLLNCTLLHCTASPKTILYCTALHQRKQLTAAPKFVCLIALNCTEPESLKDTQSLQARLGNIWNCWGTIWTQINAILSCFTFFSNHTPLAVLKNQQARRLCCL